MDTPCNQSGKFASGISSASEGWTAGAAGLGETALIQSGTADSEAGAAETRGGTALSGIASDLAPNIGLDGGKTGISEGSGFIHSGISSPGAALAVGCAGTAPRGEGVSPRIHSGMISTGLEAGADVSLSQSGTSSEGGWTAAGDSDGVTPFIHSGTDSAAGAAFNHSGSGPISALVG